MSGGKTPKRRRSERFPENLKAKLLKKGDQIILKSIFPTGKDIEFTAAGDIDELNFVEHFLKELRSLKPVLKKFEAIGVTDEKWKFKLSLFEKIDALNKIVDEMGNDFDNENFHRRCFPDSSPTIRVIHSLLEAVPVSFPVIKTDAADLSKQIKLNYSTTMVQKLRRRYSERKLENVVFIENNRAHVFKKRNAVFGNEDFGVEYPYIDKFFNSPLTFLEYIKKFQEYLGAKEGLYAMACPSLDLNICDSEVLNILVRADVVILDDHSLSNREIEKLLRIIVPKFQDGTQIVSSMDLLNNSSTSKLTKLTYTDPRKQLVVKDTLKIDSENVIVYEVNREELEKAIDKLQKERNLLLPPAWLTEFLSPCLYFGDYISIDPANKEDVLLVYNYFQKFFFDYIDGEQKGKLLNIDSREDYETIRLKTLAVLRDVNAKMVRENLRDLPTLEKLAVANNTTEAAFLFDISQQIWRGISDQEVVEGIEKADEFANTHTRQWSLLIDEMLKLLGDNYIDYFVDVTSGSLGFLLSCSRKVVCAVAVSVDENSKLLIEERKRAFESFKKLLLRHDEKMANILIMEHDFLCPTVYSTVYYFNKELATLQTTKMFLESICSMLNDDLIVVNWPLTEDEELDALFRTIYGDTALAYFLKREKFETTVDRGDEKIQFYAYSKINGEEKRERPGNYTSDFDDTYDPDY